MIGAPEPGRKAAVIGPITADSARARGFDVVAMPDDYTIAGLIGAIREWAAGAARQGSLSPGGSLYNRKAPHRRR